LILTLLRQLVGYIEQAPQVIGNMHIAGHAFNTGEVLQRLTQLGAQAVDIDIGLTQQMSHTAALLIQEGDHEMQGLNELMIPPHRQTLGIRQRHLKLAC